jgi:hypothetical protein
VLPLSPGRLERHGFEYRRNGTLSLYAALDVKTGKVQGKTAGRHTSAEFVDFLEPVVSGCKPQQEIHIILDNLSAHKTSQVGAAVSGLWRTGPTAHTPREARIAENSALQAHFPLDFTDMLRDSWCRRRHYAFRTKRPRASDDSCERPASGLRPGGSAQTPLTAIIRRLKG